MALSTRTILDSINWAKRFMFNRNPAIGNSIDPALTSANLVLQTILGPPFEWWWNNKEVTFTCDPDPREATATVVNVTDGLLTVTAPNTFSIGEIVLASDVNGNLTDLNGISLKIETASPTGFTALVTLADGAATTGTFTSGSTQDYTVDAPDFSHIEFANLLDLDKNGDPAKWQQLTVKNSLARESSTGRPEFISPNTQNADGTVTFRLMNSPDKKYPVVIQIQNAAPHITSLNQTWAPLPDYMEYIYDWGFLALMWNFSDDPRAAWANNQFKAGLLARADGLTDEEKNIFLNNWEALTAEQMMKKQQGTQARGQ